MAVREIYADIILPVPAEGTFTYRIPDGLRDKIAPGMRVIVPFGSRKFYTGIIRRLHDTAAEGFKIREIESVQDIMPVVNSLQMEFWEWISEYYLCTYGEVMKAALPSGLKPESITELFLVRIPDGNMLLSAEENKILNSLKEGKGKRLNDLRNETNILHPEKWVSLLIQKGLVSSGEIITKKYKPRTEVFINLNSEFRNPEKLDELLESLMKMPRQVDLLRYFKQKPEPTTDIEKGIRKKELKILPGYSESTLRTLINKKILVSDIREISRLTAGESGSSEPGVLTSVQKTALDSITKAFSKNKVVLLHGVTSSGKTEIYFHLIRNQVKQGRQVLYLLPEIVLTAQIVKRLRAVFGGQVGIYHSRYSDQERVETWYNLVTKPEGRTISIVLGARSAIFLPFTNLGLVIIDEEHEHSYKQADPAPRYHARDAAIILASIHNANVILGTATPSFESYYNALSGKYELVELKERYGKIELPEIRIVNLREQYRKKLMKSHFSGPLLEELNLTLEKKQQVILFQNRRGFSPFLECQSCGWVPRCKRCDVSLVYHKQRNQLVCHYCGYSMKIPGICQQCNQPDLRTRGFGTEKIVEELNLFFPGASVVRFDLDTAHLKRQYEKIILDFEEKKTDILVGTQIITKGLDFDNVGLVGILNADNLLNYPDFRAYEHSYQLLSQVAGRAGRKHQRGVVIIQTSDPENVVIRSVVKQDFRSFYDSQIGERQIFNYPPYNRLITVLIRHRAFNIVSEMAGIVAKEFANIQDMYVLGPQPPPIGRIKNWYIQKILIKIPRKGHLTTWKQRIRIILNHYKIQNKFKSVQYFLDVDPY
jgi:primosomal protein N' (replication factor Y) (superfamily II helicase)